MVEFTAQLSNLNQYAVGIYTNTPLSFPTTPKQVQAALKAIGVDGLRNSEVYIQDYTVTLPGLKPLLGEYAQIDELNYLASRLQELTRDQRVTFAAAVSHGEYTGNLQDLINLTYNLSCYHLLPHVRSYEEYGRHLVEVRSEFYLPKAATNYFDYAAYGEDTAINEGGTMTVHGYIHNNQTPFRDVYDGKNIPEQYHVLRYPLQEKLMNRLKPHKEKAHDLPNR